MFEFFKKLLTKEILEHEKRIQNIEKLLTDQCSINTSYNQISKTIQNHLNLISKNQIDLFKRVQVLERAFIAKAGLDRATAKARVDDILNLESSLKHLNSKVDYFTEENKQ